jgi:hypothetical protein
VSGIVIEAPDGYPPAAEFETVDAWLAAMPPHTSMRVTQGREPFRMTTLMPVEALIDGMALAPLIDALLREASE